MHSLPFFTTGLFINNEVLESNLVFAVTDPANGTVIANVSNATDEDCRAAIAAAHQAFPSWSTMPTRDRATILRRWYQLVMANSTSLATLLTREQGKPIAESKAEIIYGASFIEWNAEECRRSYGDIIPSPAAGKKFMTIRQPVGVVAAITPWNFPVAMVTRKISPALAAGCTVVLKPAEDTPLCALALAMLAREAGLPPGVLNVIPTNNPAAIGQVLTSDERIRKISFTGSTEVGRLLMQQSAPTVKKLSLELGGNAPVIIFNDADIDTAVSGTLNSKYRNAGQTCVCANRIYVQRDIAERFIPAFVNATRLLQTGNGLEPGVQVGPLINEEAVQKVEYLVADALQHGGVLECGGQRMDDRSLCYMPTVISHCHHQMMISKAEIFGPVSAIYLFDLEDEVINLANDTIYGLAAYCFTTDASRAWRLSEQLQYGMIGMNEGIISYPEIPFGGLKQSGFGREGGRQGIEEYLETKYICWGVNEP